MGDLQPELHLLSGTIIPIARHAVGHGHLSGAYDTGLSNVSLCADLVPVYHMGQSQLLTFWGAEKLSRRWRASIGIFWGAWGLPLPRKRPIISLVGAPIKGQLYWVFSKPIN